MDFDTQQLYTFILIRLIYSIVVLEKNFWQASHLHKKLTSMEALSGLIANFSYYAIKQTQAYKICSSALLLKIKTYKIGFFFGYLFLLF